MIKRAVKAPFLMAPIVTVGAMFLLTDTPLMDEIKVTITPKMDVYFCREMNGDSNGVWSVEIFKVKGGTDPVCHGGDADSYTKSENACKGPWSIDDWSGDPNCTAKILQAGNGYYQSRANWTLSGPNGAEQFTDLTMFLVNM